MTLHVAVFPAAVVLLVAIHILFIRHEGPVKQYDLIREGLIIVLAIIFKSPDAPTVRGEDVAKNHPLDYLKTAPALRRSSA